MQFTDDLLTYLCLNLLGMCPDTSELCYFSSTTSGSVWH